MKLSGRAVRLRAVEPDDVALLYAWENDPALWSVSGTLAPFSQDALSRFIERQQHADIYRTGQLRLMIETLEGVAVGAIDLFEFDHHNLRAGVGILIYDPAVRCRGYASDALRIIVDYAREVLRLHQLWCTVGTNNRASLALFRNAGFHVTGIRREWNRTEEGYADELLLQMRID